jgi:hypothetical protein
MNEQESRDITRQVMRDLTPVATNINIAEAWLLLGAIQQTLRGYPSLTSVTRKQMFNVAEQMETAIVRSHPGAKDLIAAGWDFVEDQEEIKAQVDRFLVSANDEQFR